MDSLAVLLIEDSPFMSDHAQELLSVEHGFDVTTAQTVEAARDILDCDGHKYDCILVNHKLPDRSGIEFTRQSANSPPIILFTASKLNEVAKQALDAGVAEIVSKRTLDASMAVLANRIHMVVQATTRSQEPVNAD